MIIKESWSWTNARMEDDHFFCCVFISIPCALNIYFYQFINVVFLTNSISATIDQHRFNETIPRKTNKKHHDPSYDAVINAIKIIGADTNRPIAHICGSHWELICRPRCAKYEPSGTPTNPANIAIIPNSYDMLFVFFFELKDVFFKERNKERTIVANG